MAGPNSVVAIGSPAYKAAMAARARAAQARPIMTGANMPVQPIYGSLNGGRPTAPPGRAGTPPLGDVVTTPIINQLRKMPSHLGPQPASINAPNAQVVAIQKALVKKGYHINVDGIMGPQTKAALYASQHPTGPHTNTVPDPNATVKAKTPNNQSTTSPFVAGGVAGAKSQPASGPGKVVSGKTNQALFPAWMNSGAKVPDWQNIGLPGYNPDELAQSAIDAKYAPILSGYDTQTQQVTNAGVNRQDMISGVYDKTITGAEGDTNAANAAIQAAADKTAGIPAAVAAAMGLSPEMAASLAGQGIINAKGVADTAALGIKEDNQALQNMRLGKEYTSNQAAATTESDLAKIRGEKQDQLNAKGSDLAAAKMQARSDYADKVTAIQEANRQGKLTTAQAKQAVNQAGRDARLTYLNILAGAKSAGIQLAGLNEQAREFDVKQAFDEKQLASQTALTKLKIGQSNLGRADNAAQGAYKTIVGPRGWPKYGTNRAYAIASQQLQAAGLKPGTKAFQQRMNYVMNAAHIKLGPGGKPVGLAGKRPK